MGEVNCEKVFASDCAQLFRKKNGIKFKILY